jgi:hypothetical protein
MRHSSSRYSPAFDNGNCSTSSRFGDGLINYSWGIEPAGDGPVRTWRSTERPAARSRITVAGALWLVEDVSHQVSGESSAAPSDRSSRSELMIDRKTEA